MTGPCGREEAVVRAVLDERWTAPLEAHVEGCAECRETVAVAGWMREVAVAAREAAAEGLPDASEIWWRAEVLARVGRRRALVHEAVRPIERFERWGGVAAAAAVGVATWAALDDLPGWLESLGVAARLADPASVLPVGLAAAAALVVSTGLFVERLREL